MRRLILERAPAGPLMWLTEAPFLLDAPPGAALALHLARPSPLGVLCVGERRIPAGPEAGWRLLEAPPPGPLAVRAEGAPLALSLDAAARPALRVWEGAAEGDIPEGHWQAARILGRGAVAALGAGPARPLLRLAAGEAAWITLPALDLPALPAPRLEMLRGPAPRHRLHWGLPGAPRARGPAPLTLALRAGLASELVWVG
ncbi:hypothetical protein [Rubritepida flocculans]|uniref:hypothetical protein n=1 Tax=Rubritepida flocculans TaxID=182403 RepID=UPI0004023499|nr:hypothetical protein [Rubritepida flocculans]